jgi:AcrR family transcriptional regulator
LNRNDWARAGNVVNLLSRWKEVAEVYRVEKRTLILDAASRCFLKAGYTDTSIDDIVSQSRVAKQTIYNYFKDKDVLFKAVVDYELKSISLDVRPEWNKLGLQEFLCKVGKAQLNVLQDPHTRDVLRLLVKESRKFPELQSIYAESIPEPFIAFVCDFMQTANLAQQDEAVLRAKTWCFRAALTGYATLSNLGPMIGFSLPNKTTYLSNLALLFEPVFRMPGTFKSDKPPQWNARKTDDEAERFFSMHSTGSEGEKRRAILTGALKSFSTRDFSELSMDDVAETSGVSKQTIYKHFRSKNLLYQDLLKVVVARLQQSTDLSQHGTDSRQRITNCCKALLEGARQTGLGGYFRTVIGTSHAFPVESGLLLLYLFEFRRQELENHIEAAGKGNKIDAISTSVAIRGIIGSFLLLRYIYSVGEDSFANESQLISIIDAMVQVPG